MELINRIVPGGFGYHGTSTLSAQMLIEKRRFHGGTGGTFSFYAAQKYAHGSTAVKLIFPRTAKELGKNLSEYATLNEQKIFFLKQLGLINVINDQDFANLACFALEYLAGSSEAEEYFLNLRISRRKLIRARERTLATPLNGVLLILSPELRKRFKMEPGIDGDDWEIKVGSNGLSAKYILGIVPLGEAERNRIRNSLLRALGTGTHRFPKDRACYSH